MTLCYSVNETELELLDICYRKKIVKYTSKTANIKKAILLSSTLTLMQC